MKKMLSVTISLLLVSVCICGCAKENHMENDSEENVSMNGEEKSDSMVSKLFESEDQVTLDMIGGCDYWSHYALSLRINSDGTFEGWESEFKSKSGWFDSQGKDYACPIYILSHYTGSFSELEKIGDYEYLMKVEKLEYDEGDSNYEVEGYYSDYPNDIIGIEVRYVAPEGFEEGQTLTILAPGTPYEYLYSKFNNVAGALRNTLDENNTLSQPILVLKDCTSDETVSQVDFCYPDKCENYVDSINERKEEIDGINEMIAGATFVGELLQ